jgi:2-polyprenyl-3-methyl-5-hydroxy-6-metoxy-1,4-benzoquinol methylase
MQHGLSLTTVICQRCGFVFTNPLPEKEIYERFYTEAYSTYYGHIAASPHGEKRVNMPKTIERRLDQIKAIGPLTGARLLEAGPGYGLFLWWAQKQGAEVLGVEPSPDFYRELKANGTPAILGSLEDIDIDQVGQFDIITMFHVLEHFYDPNDALVRCRNLLQPRGLLVVEVPNILKPFRHLDRYFLRYVHPCNFSPETLCAMLEKHGFDTLIMDQGGDDWRSPQNLFVIGRKRERVPSEWSFPRQSAGEVLHHLRRYQSRWSLTLGPSWLVLDAYRATRKAIFGGAHVLKQHLTTGGVG